MIFQVVKECNLWVFANISEQWPVCNLFMCNAGNSPRGCSVSYTRVILYLFTNAISLGLYRFVFFNTIISVTFVKKYKL
jgi:hypothetical protein